MSRKYNAHIIFGVFFITCHFCILTTEKFSNNGCHGQTPRRSQLIYQTRFVQDTTQHENNSEKILADGLVWTYGSSWPNRFVHPDPLVSVDLYDESQNDN